MAKGQRKSRIYAYMRVSSDKQDLEVQKGEIQRYAATKGLEVSDWFELEMSATKNGMAKRRIEELLKSLAKGDVLIVSEFSRLARSVKELHMITEALIKKAVVTHSIREGMVLVEGDLTSLIQINAFGLAAQIEAYMISQRTKEGLKRAVQKGRKIGNPNLRPMLEARQGVANEFAQGVKGVLQGLIARGCSQREIIVELNRANMKGPGGGVWGLSTVQRTLRRLGLRTHRHAGRRAANR